jgi:hypothetical protein
MIRLPVLIMEGSSIRYVLVLLLFSSSAQTIAPWCRHWKQTNILKVVNIVVITSIIPIVFIKGYYCHYCVHSNNWLFLLLLLLLKFILFYRMAGISRISNCIWARLQEPGTVSHSDSKYPGETASCTVVPVSYTRTIPYYLCKVLPNAPGNCRPGDGDRCRMCFKNSWALGLSCDM